MCVYVSVSVSVSKSACCRRAARSVREAGEEKNGVVCQCNELKIQKGVDQTENRLRYVALTK